MIRRLAVALVCASVSQPAFARQQDLGLREIARARLESGVAVAVDFGPEVLACGGSQGDVVCIDSETRAVLARFDACSGPVATVRFSPTGGDLAVLGGGVLEIRSWPDCKPRLASPRTTTWTGGGSAIAWHPALPLLAYCHAPRGITVFDVAESRVVATCTIPGRPLTGIAFAQGGDAVEAGRARGPFARWQWRTGELDRVGSRRLQAPMPWVTADGQRVVIRHRGETTVEDGVVRVPGDVLACSANRRWTATVDKDFRVRVFDRALRAAEVFEARRRRRCTEIAISDDGEFVALAGDRIAVQLWKRGQLGGELRVNAARPARVRFDGTGTRVVAGDGEFTHCIDVRAGGVVRALGPVEHPFEFGPHPTMLVFARGHDVLTADVVAPDWSSVDSLIVSDDQLAWVAPSPRDPDALVAWGRARGVMLLDGDASTELDCTGVTSCAWSRDGTRFALLATIDWQSQEVSVHDAHGGAELWTFRIESGQDIALSPRGDRVIGLGDELVSARRPGRREPEVTRRSDAGFGGWVEFLDDRRVLAHCGGTLQVIDAETLETMQQLDVGAGIVHDLDLAPARNALAVAGARDVVVYAIDRAR